MSGSTLVRGPAVDERLRVKFNPNMLSSWFAALLELLNMCTMVSLLLTAANLVRERDHGTVERLLVSPARPYPIVRPAAFSTHSRDIGVFLQVVHRLGPRERFGWTAGSGQSLSGMDHACVQQQFVGPGAGRIKSARFRARRQRPTGLGIRLFDAIGRRGWTA
jgi:hypothetical protein